MSQINLLKCIDIPEIIHIILSHLNLHDINSIGLVSRHLTFCQMAAGDDDLIWKPIYCNIISKYSQIWKDVDIQQHLETGFKKNLVMMFNKCLTKAKEKYQKRLNKLSTDHLAKQQEPPKDEISTCPFYTSDILDKYDLKEMKQFEKCEHKLVIIGDGAVGKSTLIYRLESGQFSEYIHTGCYSNPSVTMKINNDVHNIGLW